MYAYLININTQGNHNKYYEMKQTDKNFFQVLYGRVGAKPMVRSYPISAWSRKYKEKLDKGYVDRSDLRNVTDMTGSTVSPAAIMGYSPISDPNVRDFMDDILQWSNKSLTRNYRVKASEVSQKMINEAQKLLDLMDKEDTVVSLNKYLMELFTVIPRRMSNVKDQLLTDMTQKNDVLYREHELLDQMAARVDYCEKEKSGGKTILDAYGLEIELVQDGKRIAQIKSHLGEMENKFFRTFRIKNKQLDDAFYKKMHKEGYTEKDIHYLYHGSRNANWYGIMTQGLILHPNAVRNGSMFGNGLYFANKARKSTGYSSLDGYSTWAKEHEEKGYIAVYKVLYRNAKHVSKWKSSYSSLNKNSIKPSDALFAHGGVDLYNDEIIVYDEKQVTLQYVIEFRK